MSKETETAMNERQTIFDVLTGRNDQGTEPLDEEILDEVEPEAVQRVLEATLNRAALGGITDQDAQLITGISQHVDGGLFHNIARRRGSGWRLVAALADRVVQFEGLAKVHIAIALQAQNMDIALALKSLSTLQRLEFIMKACEAESPELQEFMARGIATAQDRVLRVWEKAPDDYLRDTSRRME